MLAGVFHNSFPSGDAIAQVIEACWPQLAPVGAFTSMGLRLMLKRVPPEHYHVLVRSEKPSG